VTAPAGAQEHRALSRILRAEQEALARLLAHIEAAEEALAQLRRTLRRGGAEPHYAQVTRRIRAVSRPVWWAEQSLGEAMGIRGFINEARHRGRQT
jgi:hypothetical protein